MNHNDIDASGVIARLSQEVQNAILRAVLAEQKVHQLTEALKALTPEDGAE